MGTTTIADFMRIAEEFWPPSDADDWDRVGLAVGNPQNDITNVLLAVDPVHATVREATQLNAEVLFTHHPLMLRGVNTVAENTGKGSLVTQLIKNNCALYSAHTNADKPDGGVSSVIASALGLRNVTAIHGDNSRPDSFGIGRVGDMSEAVTLERFAELVAEIMPATVSGVRVAGHPQRKIQRVALLGGAGDSLLNHPSVLGADVYLTSDLRHHPTSEMVETSHVAAGPALVDVSHWASESLWLTHAAKMLSARMPNVRFHVSRVSTDPWQFLVNQRSSSSE